MKVSKEIDEIKKKTERIFKAYDVGEAYIFGSYARGDFTEDSDIDIIIVSKKIKSLLTIGAILEELKEALEKDVDLIEEECFEGEMDEDEQKFYDTIKKERVKIYGR